MQEKHTGSQLRKNLAKDNCKDISSGLEKLNTASWVYDNAYIQRLTLNQLCLVKKKSWQEENSREKVRMPNDPLYDDQGFMELIRLIKGSSACSKFVKIKVKQHHCWLGFRELSSDTDNLNVFTYTVLLKNQAKMSTSGICPPFSTDYE